MRPTPAEARETEPNGPRRRRGAAETSGEISGAVAEQDPGAANYASEITVQEAGGEGTKLSPPPHSQVAPAICTPLRPTPAEVRDTEPNGPRRQRGAVETSGETSGAAAERARPRGGEYRKRDHGSRNRGRRRGWSGRSTPQQHRRQERTQRGHHQRRGKQRLDPEVARGCLGGAKPCGGYRPQIQRRGCSRARGACTRTLQMPRLSRSCKPNSPCLIPLRLATHPPPRPHQEPRRHPRHKAGAGAGGGRGAGGEEEERPGRGGTEGGGGVNSWSLSAYLPVGALLVLGPQPPKRPPSRSSMPQALHAPSSKHLRAPPARIKHQGAFFVSVSH